MYLPEIFERSALMNALPTAPGPGDSKRPRANTTSASGQAAAAGATAPGLPAGITTGAVSSAAANSAAAMTAGNRRHGKTLTMSDVSDPRRPALGDFCGRAFRRAASAGTRAAPRCLRRGGGRSVFKQLVKQAAMERLSGLDAFFLYLETPTQPLNVCCVLELDTSTMPGGYSYNRFRTAVVNRVSAVPEFRMKLADNQLNLDHPVWVDDENSHLRAPCTPHRCAAAGRTARAGRDLWLYCRAAAGPRPPAVGDVGDRGRRPRGCGDGDAQGASRRGRRRGRGEPARPVVQPAPGRAATAARRRRGRRPPVADRGERADGVREAAAAIGDGVAGDDGDAGANSCARPRGSNDGGTVLGATDAVQRLP